MNPDEESSTRSAQSVSDATMTSSVADPALIQPIEPPRRKRWKILKLVLVFAAFFAIGFVVSGLLLNKNSGYITYNGKAPFSFQYPKDWILMEEDTTAKEYGSYKITIRTPDYESKENEDDFSEITTKGYRFSIYYTKDHSVFKNTDEIYEYLSREKAAGLKKVETNQKITLVQNVGQKSAFIGYSNNTSTKSSFSKDGYNYSLAYEYPNKEDFTPDASYLNQYNHLLNTFTEKK